MNIRLVGFVTAVTLLASACGSDDSNGLTKPPLLPLFTNVAVAANANSVLAADVSFDVGNADSGRVVYWTGSGAKQMTPYTRGIGGDTLVHLPVLGLRPASAYSFYIQATGAEGSGVSDTVTLTTGALPAFLASASFTSTAPARFGYILTALYDGSIAYATAFDSTGAVAWYHAFPGSRPAAEIKQELNGDITVMISTSHGGEPVTGQAYAVRPDGSIARTFSAPASSYLDPHEMWELFTDNGDYNGALFYAYTQRHLNLSGTGGPADSVVSGHQLIRQDAAGTKTVLFDAWDHFALTDNVEPTPGQIDFDHPNALSISPDGNYVTSWRNLDVIVKIDATTGAIIWKLASPFSHIASDFAITADPLNGFSAQHGVRAIDDTHILIFDNGTKHATQASRALEYNLDGSAHTASMVFAFNHAPPIYTIFTGSVQRFVDQSTFVGYTYGANLVATEVNTGGTVTWEGTLVAPGTQVPYRFVKIRSLYSYEKP